MLETKHILIPEWVPLENKGEEAIVRGIADVVFSEGNYELHVFDDINSYKYDNGIHRYPLKWFISPWLTHEFGLGLSYEKIRDSTQSLIRNGLHKFIPSWVTIKDPYLKQTIKEIALLQNNNIKSKKYLGLENILKLNYIIAGHDGAMNERVAHVIDEMTKALQIPFGVFGIEFPQVFKSSAIIKEQQRVLKNSLFFYCRTEASKGVVDKNFPLIKAEVRPDPAFGMKPSTPEIVDEYLTEKGLIEFFKKPVIVCTTCETGPIARYCFQDEKSPGARINAHREFYASLIQHVTNTQDVNILFLPHALGPGRALNDIIIAQDVVQRIGENIDQIEILDDDIPAKLLKGIISKSDFLIAERIHSMIGAVGVSTPFLCLGSKTDRRVKGIIDKMVGATNSIYYMNNPVLNDVVNKFDALWNNREHETNRLKNVSEEFLKVHNSSAENIRKSFLIDDK